MLYNYKQDYKHIFDTPAKMEQESVIVNKIFSLLNNNKYDSIYDFINRNHTYQDFLKNNELENVVKHFGNTLTEEDFMKILDEIVKVSEKKRTFEKDNIKTQNVDGKEYTTYTGNEQNFYFDNSHSNMSIEKQLEELQKTQAQFQTTDAKENTDRMMVELKEEKKESLNLSYLHEIDVNKLNEQQKEMFNVAQNYQLNKLKPMKIDIERGIIVDPENNIRKIVNNNGVYSIIGETIEKETEKVEEQHTIQKKLTPSPNTIYNGNN